MFTLWEIVKNRVLVNITKFMSYIFTEWLRTHVNL